MSANAPEAAPDCGNERVPPFHAQKNTLRDNLESIAIAILLVLALRQLVVEAFKIPTGSMAPTLLGVHKEVRCPNCGWVFDIGHHNVSEQQTVVCPNCGYEWEGASSLYRGEFCTDTLEFKRPAWLWLRGISRRCHAEVVGSDAANRILRGGGRIFVNKFIYRLRKPRRWEVVVFLYPFYKVTCRNCGWTGDVKRMEGFRCPVCGSEDLNTEQRNFIKRMVGLPNEKLTIQNGDIYVNGQIARKPPPIQERMWMHVFDSRFMPTEVPTPLWDFGADSRLWRTGDESGSLVLNALGSNQPVYGAFARSILDSYGYNGVERAMLAPRTGFGTNHVGDCRLSVYLKLLECDRADSAGVALRIIEDDHDFSISIPVAPAGLAVLRDGSRVLARAHVSGLKPGVRTRVVLENYDDRIVAKLRHKTILSYEYTGNPAPSLRRNAVEFGGYGARVLFDRTVIERDIFYISRNGPVGTPRTYELADGQYFVLGDNSPCSSDSRFWPEPYVPEENLIGEAFFVFWPIHRLRLLSFGAGE